MNLLTEGIAAGNVRKTARKEKHSIDGVVADYDVYQIRADLLFFNDQNDRIATWVSEYGASHDESLTDLDLEEYNKVIEDFIVQSNTAALRKTEGDIALRGQIRPGVVLNDGRVIDGNRRFTCVRRISRKNNEPGWFEAVILDDAVGSDPKRIKLLELGIQIGEEERVAYDPVDRLVGVYKDVIKNGLITPAEYAKATGMNESQVDNLIARAQYMEEFLEFCNAPEQYHLARTLKVDGPLGEFKRILNKQKSKRDKALVKKLMFSNIIARPEGDITRYIRVFADVVGTDAESGFRGAQRTAMERLLVKMGCEPLTKEKVAQLRSDTSLSGEFERAYEKARATLKREKLIEAPVKKSAEAYKCLNQILPEMLMREDRLELIEVRSNLHKVISKAEEILGEIDGLA